MNKKGITIAAIGLIAAVAIGGKLYAGKVADEKIHQAIASVNATDTFKYDDVSVGLLGGVTLSSVVAGPHGEIKADAVVVSSLDRDALETGRFPAYGDIRIKDFDLAMSEQEMRGAFPMLYELGYRNVHGDLHLEYTYSADDKKLKVDEASLTLDGAGTLAFDMAVEVPLTSISDPLVLMAVLNQAKLSSISMSMENDGLVDHIFTAAKNEQKLDKDAFLQQIEKQASSTSNATQKEMLTAVHDFLDGGDEFKASIKPSSPVNLTRVANAIQRGDFTQLNISVEGS